MKRNGGVKCVAITGASSGIGQATAEAFARQAKRLVLAARDAEPLEAVAATCRELGSEVLTMTLDVDDAAAVCELAEAAKAFGPGIDLWFSNVGVGAVGRFTEVPIDVHERVIRSNLIGHMNDAHAVLPIFQEQGRGIFVNMISVGGLAAAPYAASYCASKFGLRGFSESLRAELSDYPQIRICDVYPSFVDTPAIGHAGNYTGKKLTAPPPLLDPRAVAAAVVRLAKHPRDSVMIGSGTFAGRLAHLISPALTGWSTKLLFDRYFATAEPVPVTGGNVFGPPGDGGQIDGGLRRQKPRSRPGAKSLIVLLAVGGAAMFAGSRRSR
jgi:short-subunit dehydrogenase